MFFSDIVDQSFINRKKEIDSSKNVVIICLAKEVVDIVDRAGVKFSAGEVCSQ